MSQKKRDTFENVCQIDNIHFCGIILVCMESWRTHLLHDMSNIEGKSRISEQCSFKYEVSKLTCAGFFSLNFGQVILIACKIGAIWCILDKLWQPLLSVNLQRILKLTFHAWMHNILSYCWALCQRLYNCECTATVHFFQGKYPKCFSHCKSRLHHSQLKIWYGKSYP